ncbi:C11orf73 family protein [Megaselia abdita]
MGAAVYFSWPNDSNCPSWQYLGFISNNKPSAIFKIAQLKKSKIANNNSMVFGNMSYSHMAQIGISIEPESNIIQLTSAIVDATEHLQFGQKMLENCFNYISSFARQIPPTNESVVPVSSIKTWYLNFSRRLEQNPNFWKVL